jgi:hypothetical protein
MKRCKLTLVEPLEKPRDADTPRLRTKTVYGVMNKIPCPHERFEMYAAPVDKEMQLRYISTSEVKPGITKIFKPEVATYIFETQNTKYELEVYRGSNLECSS